MIFMRLLSGFFSLTSRPIFTCFHLPIVGHTGRQGDAQQNGEQNETHGAAVANRQASLHLYKTLSVTRDNIALILYL
jgi:hypothetical protein